MRDFVFQSRLTAAATDGSASAVGGVCDLGLVSVAGVDHRDPASKRPATVGFQTAFNQSVALLALVVVYLGGGGCARTLSSGFADFETQRAVEKAAADESFPSAAEVGLAAGDTSLSSDEGSHDARADAPDGVAP